MTIFIVLLVVLLVLCCGGLGIYYFVSTRGM
jgi:hypothetical protein